MSDLTDFLLDRIAEDETLAVDAEPGPWRLDDVHLPTQLIGADRDPVIRAAKGDRDWTFQTSFVAQHVARWDPARVLAECGAKRQIIAKVTEIEYNLGGPWTHAMGDEILASLAQPYADHPDYREEWQA